MTRKDLTTKQWRVLLVMARLDYHSSHPLVLKLERICAERKQSEILSRNSRDELAKKG